MAFCSEPGCDRQRNVKGLCNAHYQRQLRPATERSTALKEIDKLLEPRDARREYHTSGATLICYRLGSGHGTQLLRFETLTEALECDAQADCSHGCQHEHTLVAYTPHGVRCLSPSSPGVLPTARGAVIGPVYPPSEGSPPPPKPKQRIVANNPYLSGVRPEPVKPLPETAFSGGGQLSTRGGHPLGIYQRPTAATEPDVEPERAAPTQTPPADPVLAGVGDLAVTVTVRLTWKRVQPRRLSRRQRKQAKH